jgi:serine/threonine protein kinase
MSHCTLSLVGKYQIGHLLGEGSFGQVKHAVDSDGNEYAIKIISVQKIQSSNLENQLKREISVLRKLKHENVVQLIEVLRNKKFIFLVTELISGGDLFDLLASRHKLSESRARTIFTQILDGVAYCHSQGVIHRDLKVENVLFTPDQKVKLGDFGFCNIVSNEADLLKTLCGTPSSIAPEILKHQEYNGSQVDIFSCGVMLFYMCAGRLPFDDNDNEIVFEMICSSKYEFPDHFSSELKNLITGMLKTIGKERYTVDEIRLHPWMTSDTLGTTDDEADEDAEHDFSAAATFDIQHLNQAIRQFNK